MLYPTRIEDHQFFANELVRKTTAGYHQNASVSVIGGLGRGKSTTGIRICLQCAELLAKKLGGIWTDYFNMEENCGIMNIEEIIAVNQVMSDTKNKVFLLDDVSPTINARRSSEKSNQDQNTIMTISRPNEHIVVRTFPHQFMVDKYVRHLSNYIVEMQRPYFSLGYTSAKIFAIESNRDDSKPREVYLQNISGEKYMRAFFRKPPEDIMKKYDERRAKAQRELERKAIASLTKKEEEINAVPKMRMGDIYKQIHKEFLEGKYGEMTLKEICRQKKVNYQSVLNNAHSE